MLTVVVKKKPAVAAKKKGVVVSVRRSAQLDAAFSRAKLVGKFPEIRHQPMGVLDAKPYQVQASVSDLAGLDPKVHANDPVLAIGCVRDFLRRKSGLGMPGAAHVRTRYAAFQALLKTSARANKKVTLAELKTWDCVNDLQDLMAEWIAANPA